MARLNFQNEISKILVGQFDSNVEKSRLLKWFNLFDFKCIVEFKKKFKKGIG